VRPPAAASASAPATLLVVDDNQDAATLLAQGLQAMGHAVHVAYDGIEALRIGGLHVFDAAFLDIGLPVMDGFELATRLRELPGFRGARLVAVTGYGQASDRQRTAAAGFDEHLVKPVELDAVEQLIAGFAANPPG
jgi:CheY-like chemotaxis protein